MKIQVGQTAKDFNVEDIYGNQIALSNYANQKLLLAFFRHAACPLCNLRVHQLIQSYPIWQSSGLNILAFFESSPEMIRKYVGQQQAPFPIIADPEKIFYKLYGVESSWTGTLRGLMRFADFSAAKKQGLMFFHPHNDVTVIPADFLIGPDLVIQTAYYGKDIGDHLPLAEINRFAELSNK
jgi:thioredoxin-dependent peroxiredoxin